MHNLVYVGDSSQVSSGPSSDDNPGSMPSYGHNSLENPNADTYLGNNSLNNPNDVSSLGNISFDNPYPTSTCCSQSSFNPDNSSPELALDLNFNQIHLDSKSYVDDEDFPIGDFNQFDNFNNFNFDNFDGFQNINNFQSVDNFHTFENFENLNTFKPFTNEHSNKDLSFDLENYNVSNLKDSPDHHGVGNTNNHAYTTNDFNTTSLNTKNESDNVQSFDKNIKKSKTLSAQITDAFSSIHINTKKANSRPIPNPDVNVNSNLNPDMDLDVNSIYEQQPLSGKRPLPINFLNAPPMRRTKSCMGISPSKYSIHDFLKSTSSKLSRPFKSHSSLSRDFDSRSRNESVQSNYNAIGNDPNSSEYSPPLCRKTSVTPVHDLSLFHFPQSPSSPKSPSRTFLQSPLIRTSSHLSFNSDATFDLSSAPSSRSNSPASSLASTRCSLFRPPISNRSQSYSGNSSYFFDSASINKFSTNPSLIMTPFVPDSSSVFMPQNMNLNPTDRNKCFSLRSKASVTLSEKNVTNNINTNNNLLSSRPRSCSSVSVSSTASSKTRRKSAYRISLEHCNNEARIVMREAVENEKIQEEDQNLMSSFSASTSSSRSHSPLFQSNNYFNN